MEKMCSNCKYQGNVCRSKYRNSCNVGGGIPFKYSNWQLKTKPKFKLKDKVQIDSGHIYRIYSITQEGQQIKYEVFGALGYFFESELKCVHQFPDRKDHGTCTQCGAVVVNVDFNSYSRAYPMLRYVEENVYSSIPGKVYYSKPDKIKEVQMEAPVTKLEVQACGEAREETIEGVIDAKKRIYKAVMNEFIDKETRARELRKTADELKEKLGVTKEEMEQLFEGE